MSKIKTLLKQEKFFEEELSSYVKGTPSYNRILDKLDNIRSDILEFE